MWRQRRSNVAILECLDSRWEGGEVGKVGDWCGWEGRRVVGGKIGGSGFYSRVGDAECVQNFSFLFLILIKGTKRQNEIAIGIACTFFGDCSWEVQMQNKNGVTIKGRNSLYIILLKPWFCLKRNIRAYIETAYTFVVGVWGSSVRENGAISKKGNFLWNRKIACEEASRNLLKPYLSEGVWMVLRKKKGR